MHRSALMVLLAIAIIGCTAPVPTGSEVPPSAAPSSEPTASSSDAATPAAGATPSAAPERALTGAELAAMVTGPTMLEHLVALDQIARREPMAEGNRATGTIGYDMSAGYVRRHLFEASYFVELQAFDAGGVPSENLIADIGRGGDGVIIVGAHLDSVRAGPGINDNGSGVAALLAIAEALRDLPRPDRTIRFAFWGAEEGGPFGSAAYVASLDAEERAEIVAYLNFDMIASPNAVRFVYAEPGAAPGSSDVTEAFAAYFEDAGLPWEPIDLSGDSDHGPFTAAGTPTGGLFSGGIEPVTEAQAATFGAVAGEPADPCSHRACDTIDNVDLTSLEPMADAIAHVLVTLASTDD